MVCIDGGVGARTEVSVTLTAHYTELFIKHMVHNLFPRFIFKLQSSTLQRIFGQPDTFVLRIHQIIQDATLVRTKAAPVRFTLGLPVAPTQPKLAKTHMHQSHKHQLTVRATRLAGYLDTQLVWHGRFTRLFAELLETKIHRSGQGGDTRDSLTLAPTKRCEPSVIENALTRACRLHIRYITASTIPRHSVHGALDSTHLVPYRCWSALHLNRPSPPASEQSRRHSCAK